MGGTEVPPISPLFSLINQSSFGVFANMIGQLTVDSNSPFILPK